MTIASRLRWRAASAPVAVAVAAFIALAIGMANGGAQPPAGLIGLNSVSIGSTPAAIDSFDSAQGPYGPGNKGALGILVSNGPIAINGTKVYGSVRSTASSVTIAGSSLVTGSVTAGTSVANAGTVQGSIAPNSPTSPVAATAVAPCGPFSPSAGITGKFTYSAATGDLTISSNGTVTFAAGAYCFRNVTMTGNATIAVGGPVSITLTGKLYTSGTSLNPTSIPANMQVRSSYTGTDGVVFAGTSKAYLTIYAPHTNVSLSGSAQLFGSALGKTLTTSGSAAMHFDVSLGGSTPPPPPPTNQAPVVSAGASTTITMPASATLAGSVTDDGLPVPAALTYVWSQDSGPAPALVANPTQAASSAQFVMPGIYVLRLTASDGAMSASATTQITVVDGGPALAPTPNRTIPLGTRFTTQLAADDGNPNDTLTFFLDAAPAGAAFNPNPVVDWTPSAAQVGLNTFTARVVDAAGHSDTKTFHVTVTSANRPPQIDAQADQNVASGGSFTRVLTASDPDNDALTFSLVSGPLGLSLSGNQLTWSPAALTAGTYPVTVKVTDTGGLFDGAQFKLKVFSVSTPVAADDAYEISLGQTLNVAAPGVLTNDSDPDGGGVTAQQTTSPNKGLVTAFNPDGGFLYAAPAAPQGPVLDVKRVMEWGISGGGSIEVGLAPPLVVDLTGDGKPEILAFQFNADLYAIRGDTGATLFHASLLPAAQIGGMTCSLYGMGGATYAAADIDDDGQVEIVLPAQCAGDAGQFFASGAVDRAVAIVYDPQQPEGYRVKWLTPLLSESSGPYMTSNTNFAIARLHPQDKPSILFGKTFYGPGACAQVRAAFTDFACRVVFALNGADGSIGGTYYSAPQDIGSLAAYHFGNNTSNGGFMSPIVADMDNDDALEILYEGTLWNVNGTVKQQFDGSATTGRATHSSGIADLDGDAQMEIVTLYSYGNGSPGALQAWKANGQRLWTVPSPTTFVPTKLSIADVDRDGRPEIIYGLFNGIWVWDAQGRVKWIRSMSTAADGGGFQFFGGGSTFPVYDLNGDGILEMILQYGKNTIRFLRADTGDDQIAFTYPGRPVFEGSQSPLTPVIADIDGSGHASVVWYHDVNVNGTSFLQVLRGDTLAWRPAPAHFNQAAYWETNFGDDGSVPETYTRHTTEPRTNVYGQQPPAPYPPQFVGAEETVFTYRAVSAAGSQSNEAKVTITLRPANRPPVFVSKPPKFYVPFNAVNYASQAVDPDLGDVITYSLEWTDGLTSGTMNPATGLLAFNLFHNSDHHAIIKATDSHGAFTYQAFTMMPVAGFATVPSVVGMLQPAAETALSSALLTVGEIVQLHNGAPAGTVLAQFPTGGANLPQSESIDLTVSLGPTPVALPNVVGQAKTAATSTLVSKGFSVTITSVFSNDAPAGTVIGQQPPAGTMLQPGNAVTLTVSAGNGLTLALTRSITTADQTIGIVPAAFDENGQPAALPALTYTIAPTQTPLLGTLPTVSGTTITPGTATLGGFTVTATDAVNARSASAEFAVMPPRVGGQTTNGEVFAHMAEALDAMFALRQPLRAAREADDFTQMTALLQQFVTIWRTVDLDELRISQPLVTPTGFAPTLDMVAATPTADDLLTNQVLRDAIADLTAWTTALKTSGVTIGQLNALADQFSSRAARMDTLTISRWGGINNVPLYTRLMSRAIPEFYETLSEQLAELTGMPPRTPVFQLALNGDAAPVRGPRLVATLASASPTMALAPEGSLAELAVTTAVDLVVEKIMEEAAAVYKNAKQFAVDVMTQSAWTAAAVATFNELRAFLKGEEIPAVVSGASFSFRVFKSAPAWVEAVAEQDPEVNVVMFIGPDLFIKTKETGEDFVKKLMDGYSNHVDPNTNPNRYQNANQIRSDLGAFMNIIKNAVGNVNAFIDQQAELVFQKPTQVLEGCAFTSLPGCKQLVYDNGIAPVYTYNPPPGFESLGGLPVPIITIVYNAATGGMSIGVPPFLPCKIGTDGKPLCPNETPQP